MKMNKNNLKNKLPEWARVNGKFSLVRNKILRNYYYERYNFVSKLLSNDNVSNLIARKKVLDVGCGVGNFLDILYKFGFETYGIDFSESAIKKIHKRDAVVRSYIPPIPFRDSSFDFVVALGFTEHVLNEKNFIEEVYRVIKKNGIYICSIPIEIGIAGFIRHITKNIVYRDKSIFDYSIEEIKGKCPREKHGVDHKYYNYKYLINDLNEYFASLELYYWPRFLPSMFSPIMFARCVKL